MDIKKLIGDLRSFAKEAKDKKEEYEPEIEKAKKGLEKVQEFLDKIQKGKHDEAETMLTEWEDVNETIRAIQSVQEVIDEGSGLTLDKVIGVTAKGVGVATKLAAFL